MKRRDFVAGLFWLGISLFVILQSLKSDLGSLRTPGPGFLPFWSAIILGALSSILIVTAILKKAWEGTFSAVWKGLNWARVAWVLLALFLYPVLLPVTGYLIATFVLIAFLLCVIVRSRPWVDLASALVITLISYVIFYRLLDVKFPKGMLGL